MKVTLGGCQGRHLSVFTDLLHPGADGAQPPSREGWASDEDMLHVGGFLPEPMHQPAGQLVSEPMFISISQTQIPFEAINAGRS